MSIMELSGTELLRKNQNLARRFVKMLRGYPDLNAATSLTKTEELLIVEFLGAAGFSGIRLEYRKTIGQILPLMVRNQDRVDSQANQCLNRTVGLVLAQENCPLDEVVDFLVQHPEVFAKQS